MASAAHTALAARPAWTPRAVRDGMEDNKGREASEKVAVAKFGPLKEWPAIYQNLVDRDLQSVTGEEALKMVRDEGAVLVDVRLESIFKTGTMEGAINVPFFQPVAGDSLSDNFKRIATFAMGMQAKERNPNFSVMALERLPRDRPIIVSCNRGGNLVTNRRFAYGQMKDFSDTDQYTLTFKAVYELYEAGFTKVSFLKGGISQWRYSGLPMAPGGTQN
eukprot:gnl/MRDRNA2_/MRDRNA2_195019_c0_seq1.p1 gnl/MRDRNA2_/MRDRNA2_195019_c0~~gnl/MRDRNA2_/MRDRNA2_195019_c0_seq1.p1  ORF type:complete len:255 (-),score=28.72 gnl/MRDRNA2_/MRDRNA2_195019_c0_seq1:138-794(-)